MDVISSGFDFDEKCMSRALYLARKGVYSTHPNPMVGCVIAKHGEVVGEGWHQYAGSTHAEIAALQQAAGKSQGATMYVTLEPCNHHGKTPPCTQEIIKQEIARVVIATQDPNLATEKAGIEELRHAGIDVVLGVGKQPASEINRAFFKRVTTQLPWVTLKIASSLDGKTSMSSGESRWITGEASRLDAQKLRASSSAVMTGIGTVLRDDPQMNVRLPGVSRQPMRVILDSNLRTPTNAKILSGGGNVIIFTSMTQNDLCLEHGPLDDAELPNVEIIPCRGKAEGVDLCQVLYELANKQVNSVLVEAGSHLSGSILRQNLVDEVVLYMSPDVLGSNTRELFTISDVNNLRDKICLRYKQAVRVGDDLRLTLDVINTTKS